MVLDKVNSPKDLKKLSIKEKKELSLELRNLIIETVSNNGGHLASNLGVVELTIALHSVLDTPIDKIIFDVGHQCYVHKILTGRKDKINTIRKFDGLSGFPKAKESSYDTFDTGHSSTSISNCAGIARARDLLNEDYRVVAVIGDGSMTGGMALEALNDVGSSNLDMTVILNDNEMSISKNVGGIPLLLSKLRTKKSYTKLNVRLKKIVSKIPILGRYIILLVQRIKRLLKQVFIKNMYFEDIGFTYLGPVDGHDIEVLEDILKSSKTINGPVLIHVITKKGKGYSYAEKYPDRFHGTSSFDIKTGEKLGKKTKDYSKVFGDKLCEMAIKNNNIVAVTAAMMDGTGLSCFKDKFKNRFFDVGIAEQHAIGLIAGMAKAGLKPYFPVYSSFLQRGYDQLIHDIALQNLPVVICVDRAGIVGNDGETHQGIFDLSYLSTIPNMTIMAPKDFNELESMLEFSLTYDKCIAIRYPRGGEGKFKFKKTKIKLGYPEIIEKGNDLTIIAIGNMVTKAMEVKSLLPNISIEIVNIRFLKPLNEKSIVNILNKTKNIVTIEDNLLKGGLRDEILRIKEKYNLDSKIMGFGYNDEFICHGTVGEIEKKYGLDSISIASKIKKEFKKKV